jgi:hypothetical protein
MSRFVESVLCFYHSCCCFFGVSKLSECHLWEQEVVLPNVINIEVG